MGVDKPDVRFVSTPRAGVARQLLPGDRPRRAATASRPRRSLFYRPEDLGPAPLLRRRRSRRGRRARRRSPRSCGDGGPVDPAESQEAPSCRSPSSPRRVAGSRTRARSRSSPPARSRCATTRRRSTRRSRGAPTTRRAPRGRALARGHDARLRRETDGCRRAFVLSYFGEPLPRRAAAATTAWPAG